MARSDFLQSVEHAVAEAVEQHDRIALLYSGGVESSSLLLHLLLRTATGPPSTQCERAQNFRIWSPSLIGS